MKTSFITLIFLGGAVLTWGQGTGRGRGPAAPQGEREVTVTEIPGVVAANAKWTLVWTGTPTVSGGVPIPEIHKDHGANADGIVGSSDGGLLFAQEQPSRVLKLDKNGKLSVFLENTHGTGALSIDSSGRIFGVERTCTDPGGDAAHCTEATAVAMLMPQQKILADNFGGQGLGRLNDLIVDKKGGVYFNGTLTYYVDPRGKVISIGENVRTNGITLSRDEKTLYVTNGGTLFAFDVQPDGSVMNQREFAKLEAGGAGDGMAIDSEGRVYVTSNPGVQVFSESGKYLGVIPTPRGVISVAFSGPEKKTMYVVGSGALGADGKEFVTPQGVRNNAKTIYSLPMQAQGFAGRAK
jgi:gluconolactonase